MELRPTTFRCPTPAVDFVSRLLMTGLLDWLYSLMPPNLPASEHAAGRSHSASMEPPEPQPLHQGKTAWDAMSCPTHTVSHTSLAAYNTPRSTRAA